MIPDPRTNETGGSRSFLTRRLVLATLVVLGIGVAIAGSLLIAHSERRISEQLDRRGSALAQVSAANCVEPVLSRDYPVLDDLAEHIVDEGQGVVAFRVFLENGKLVTESVAVSHSQDAESRSYREPIALQDEDETVLLGHVEISLSSRVLAEASREQVQILMLGALGLFAVLALSTWFLVRTMVGVPLIQLNRQVRSLHRSLHEPVGLARGGELVHVAESLESLRQEVLNSRQELEERHRVEVEMSREKDVLMERLQVAAREADSANRLKTSFLANTSHEIRTPLNGILGFARLLQDEELSDNGREWIDALADSGESLLQILNDVLDISKIEAGEMRLDPVSTDLRDLIHKAVANCAPIGLEKGLRIRETVDDQLPSFVDVDSLRLRQVLVNLIGNAVKFTEQGLVTVRAESLGACITPNGAGHRIRFEVVDTGIGMTPEACETVFEPFRQADGSMTRLYGGTGLGLSITGRLVELMHSKVEVTSEPNVGSTFCFVLELPVSTVAGRSAQLQDPPLPRKERGLRILLVDDSPVNRRVARAWLERVDHDVTEAGDGEDALEQLAHAEFDVILMDCQMPLMDGYEATRQIRRGEAETARPRRPIIALTANGLRGERERCLAVGMDECLQKPFEPEDLLNVIEELGRPDSEAA